MSSAALHRLERLLEEKHLGGTQPIRTAELDASLVAPTGIPSVDVTLHGGWRRGEISEVVGARSMGRTSVVMATLARATRDGEYAALIDVVDRFDLHSAVGMGVDPTQLLWVRGPALTVELARSHTLDRIMRQGLCAFDLVLRAGGFSVVILDMSDLPPALIHALPPATWLRLAHANEGRQTAGLLVGQSPMGRSARGTTMPLAGRAVWTGTSAQSRRLSAWEPVEEVRGTGALRSGAGFGKR